MKRKEPVWGIVTDEYTTEKGREQEALNAIADLCFLKRDIRLLEGKDDK